MPTLVKNLLVALGVLAVAVIGVLTSFGIVDWSAAQTALVTAEAGAIIGLLGALLAHFWPDTSKEPVALAATFTAAVSATLALGIGFAWWHLTAEQTSALGSLVSAVIGLGAAIVARGLVTAANAAG
jgi:hypothetical protein